MDAACRGRRIGDRPNRVLCSRSANKPREFEAERCHGRRMSARLLAESLPTHWDWMSAFVVDAVGLCTDSVLRSAAWPGRRTCAAGQHLASDAEFVTPRALSTAHGEAISHIPGPHAERSLVDRCGSRRSPVNRECARRGRASPTRASIPGAARDEYLHAARCGAFGPRPSEGAFLLARDAPASSLRRRRCLSASRRAALASRCAVTPDERGTKTMPRLGGGDAAASLPIVPARRAPRARGPGLRSFGLVDRYPPPTTYRIADFLARAHEDAKH